MNTEKLAKEIADDLFRTGNFNEANRLVLESLDKTDMGGWCKDAVIDAIKEHLDKALKKK